MGELKKKRTFRKFMFRGVDLDQLLDLSSEQLMEIVHARARRRFTRGLKMKPLALMKKLRKAKKEAPPNEKPAVVKTHPLLLLLLLPLLPPPPLPPLPLLPLLLLLLLLLL